VGGVRSQVLAVRLTALFDTQASAVGYMLPTQIHLAISILRLDGHINIAKATHHTARQPDRPLAMINRVAGET
jgi:hypothetical protein